MNNADQRLFSYEREQERLNILKKLNLLTPETIPVCEEATQMVARFLEIPICFLGLMLSDHLWLKSTLGLAKLGFMNPLAQERRIWRQDSFCAHVIDSEQCLIIEDTLVNPLYADLSLVKDYGIRSYLGTPLITSTGHCLGTLAVMDLVPHQFSLKNQEFLALTARWCLRELETKYFCQHQVDFKTGVKNIIDIFQVKFFQEITEKLRAPLTSVIGMSSVLKNQNYGPLNEKQQNYLEIIHKSGYSLASLIESIEELNLESEDLQQVKLSPTAPSMVAQDIIIRLKNWIDLEILSEKNEFLYLLDQKKLRQTLYYLSLSFLEVKDNRYQLNMSISYQKKTIDIAISLVNNQQPGTNFWLGQKQELELLWQGRKLKASSLAKIIQETEHFKDYYTQLLELFLSCYLAELQEGEILVQSCQDFHYQYILKLPKILAT
ncbi:GAF domain-containing protein [Gloeocapsa sp. PCC 73106]|uniref:sensor histidine kinase n=1 Tax=Gloeocapsa sp. PCC 73106 TaxID=102232 RepID=UPI0002AC49A2|nr:GAF domain-containing protein [Gloeocapsa sp. PCC 73106]ELR98962.1 GAF domain-containing protein [Gloeocapsa sp. PCC 73106]